MRLLPETGCLVLSTVDDYEIADEALGAEYRAARARIARKQIQALRDQLFPAYFATHQGEEMTTSLETEESALIMQALGTYVKENLTKLDLLAASQLRNTATALDFLES